MRTCIYLHVHTHTFPAELPVSSAASPPMMAWVSHVAIRGHHKQDDPPDREGRRPDGASNTLVTWLLPSRSMAKAMATTPRSAARRVTIVPTFAKFTTATDGHHGFVHHSHGRGVSRC